jgi:Core-2/I-Branching enzyme.
MKHAYLILAHHEFGLLQTLIDCLDDARNDIYVHIDKKVKTLPDLHADQAGLNLLEGRIDIRWADYSMVEAEFALFEAAHRKGPYAYYHLLSGVDLPLKTQDYIHNFFAEHQGQEFIGYTLKEMTPEISRRMQRWHLFPRHFSRKRNVYSAFRSIFLRIQEILGIKRNRQTVFTKGSQWVSITEEMVQYALSRQAWARKTFTHTFVPDECLMQTLCQESPFREKLHSTLSDGEGCMRAIGWRDDELIDWCADDYQTLAESTALFARKFNSTDRAFIERIARLSKHL